MEQRQKTTRNAASRSALVWLAIAAAACGTSPALAADLPAAETPSRWSVIVENDALTGDTSDRDYTAGFSVALVGTAARRIVKPNYRALEWLDKGLRADRLHHSEQVAHHEDGVSMSLLMFTPGDIASPNPIPTERPYANLLELTHARFSLDSAGEVLHESSFTLGLLGSGIAETLQRGLHRVAGDAIPAGYRYQISDGGEFTARYSVVRRSLLTDGGSHGRFDAHYSLEGSVGFVTEAAVGVGMRWGELGSPWWSAPLQTAYAARTVPGAFDGRLRGGDDFYLWAGVSLRARVYNALLQGQLRDNDLAFAASELEPFVLDAGIGVAKRFGRVRLGYAVRYHTREIRAGLGARDVVWAGFTITSDPAR
jgi:hypothetical protein